MPVAYCYPGAPPSSNYDRTGQDGQDRALPCAVDPQQAEALSPRNAQGCALHSHLHAAARWIDLAQLVDLIYHFSSIFVVSHKNFFPVQNVGVSQAIWVLFSFIV